MAFYFFGTEIVFLAVAGSQLVAIDGYKFATYKVYVILKNIQKA